MTSVTIDICKSSHLEPLPSLNNKSVSFAAHVAALEGQNEVHEVNVTFDDDNPEATSPRSGAHSPETCATQEAQGGM